LNKKTHYIRATLIVALVIAPAACLFAEDKPASGAPSEDASVAAGKDEAGFQPLFDGKTLNNWDGNPKFWSVRDGAITGQTTRENPTPGNTFLVYKGGDVADFELRFEYKIEGGNSGVQYRSKVLDARNWRVGGYQGDFEAGTTFSGILYDEAGVAGGRDIMANRGESVTFGAGDGKDKKVERLPMTSEQLQKAIKQGDWNRYEIIARGNHLIHKINGNTTAECVDQSDKALKSGVLALQLHAGPPMTVQFRNIRIKKLDGK
jgi:Domain of Unknown Function (DUF1080)